MPSVAPADQNLILTGYIGPGQLSLARGVAERLRMPFVHFDARFEAAHGMPRDELRALYGESRLKTAEGELVDEIALYRSTVLYVSGQTLQTGEHLARLAATGPVICVVSTIDAALQRLHLALGARFHDARERDLAVGLMRREWSIRDREGVIAFDASYLNEREAIEAIAALWREHAGVIDWRGV